MMIKHHSGPLPPAEELERYDHIIPNGADRIMKMAENQALHRQAMEKTIVESKEKRTARGQIFAFILALFVIITGVILIFNDYVKTGTTLSTVTVLSLVASFMYEKREQNKSKKGN